ncbi:MAG: hypothetical protein JXA16_13035 [Bacteroidales bacterium]|nr:hypothetical protein [Bacteroidales bacterium]
MQTENDLLTKYLTRRRKQGTVILCFKVLLDNAIVHGMSSTMTKSEIHQTFDKQHKNFGVGTFRSDYLLRQTSKSDLNAIGVKSDNSTFYIRPEFLVGLSKNDLKTISKEIESYYRNKLLKNKELFDLITDALSFSVEDRKRFILKLLLEMETDKKGQAFEVTAYAILKTFYLIRGFELNRFSTIYSNDGGIDFTSQMAVYQVTTHLSNKKFDEDLDKAPLKNRIFVYKNEGNGFDKSKFNHELVLDYISSDDLVNHLEYLFSKKPERNSEMILDIIQNEFEREYYL